jgi:2-hydroxychromene-2-carboxylate isomerase
MVDSLFAERGWVDDPHIWERVRRLGIDQDRFEADRRSDVVAARLRRDFESGIRAGVTATPALFREGVLLGRDVAERLLTGPAA